MFGYSYNHNRKSSLISPELENEPDDGEHEDGKEEQVADVAIVSGPGHLLNSLHGSA